MRRPRNFIGPGGMGGMVGLWGAPSLIKSIQAWNTSFTGTSGTSTITSVDTANAIVVMNGFTANDGSSLTVSEHMQRATLTNATTVTVSRGSAGNPGARAANGFVIEFRPGIIKSLQYVTQAPIGGSGSLLTITAVDTAKSFLLSLGYDGTNTGGVYGQWTGPRMAFSSATQVQMSFDGGSGLANTTGGAVVVELF